MRMVLEIPNGGQQPSQGRNEGSIPSGTARLQPHPDLSSLTPRGAQDLVRPEEFYRVTIDPPTDEREFVRFVGKMSGQRYVFEDGNSDVLIVHESDLTVTALGEAAPEVRAFDLSDDEAVNELKGMTASHDDVLDVLAKSFHNRSVGAGATFDYLGKDLRGAAMTDATRINVGACMAVAGMSNTVTQGLLDRIRGRACEHERRADEWDELNVPKNAEYWRERAEDLREAHDILTKLKESGV